MSCGYFCCISAVILLFVIYKLIDWLLRLPTVGRHADRYVLITGCDSGFGHDLTRRLDSRGCHVFAGCLTEKGETELRKVCSDRLLTVSLDVSNPESVRKAFQLVKEKLDKDNKELWGVVNNAGICPVLGPLDWMSPDDYRNTAAVNLYGLIDVTMTFLPFIKKSRGRVVNVSSMAGRIFFTGMAPYCVTKYGVEAFTDGLRRSLRVYGCHAALIEPMAFKTPFADVEHLGNSIQRAWNGAPAAIQEEYGSEYYEHFRNALPKLLDEMASERISDVTDAFEHALFQLFPRARYPVGPALKFIIIQALPEWLADRIMSLATEQGYPPRAALAAAN